MTFHLYVALGMYTPNTHYWLVVYNSKYNLIKALLYK